MGLIKAMHDIAALNHKHKNHPVTFSISISSICQIKRDWQLRGIYLS